ncbi:MAG TPA: helix-turn-helix domain-containing protein [Gemmatimonadota bacterium]|nr:helix-turn-helix domain-containing protein [Gemmatimonadota bacterium]
MAPTRKALARRLRDARETLGLTQAEVAKALGVHRPTISEIEAGRRAVTSVELYELSRIFAVPLADLLGEEPLKASEVERVLFRRQGMETPATRRALRRFVERCRTEKELESLLGWEVNGVERPSYQIQKPRGSLEALQQAEWMADRERHRLGLGTQPIRNPVELIRRQGIRVGPLNIDADEQLDGVFFEAEDLGACIGLAPPDQWTGYRNVFTAVHEYAHWLLGDLRVEEYRFLQHTADPVEVRANSFAAAFLMPTLGLRDFFDAEGLLTEELDRGDIVRAMDYFGVSRPALIYRLQNCQLVSKETADRLLQDRFSVKAAARALGLDLRTPDEVGSYLNELVVESWRHAFISTGRAAEILGVDVQTFRERMREIAVDQEREEEAPLLGASAKV